MLVVINHAGLCRALNDLQCSPPRASTRLAYGMAPHIQVGMPVLEEWHASTKPRTRPHACGVVGCAVQLDTKRQARARLCAGHIDEPAVLRSGVPQRWCQSCGKFHAPEAFSGSQRCACLTLGALWSTPRVIHLFVDKLVRSV